MKLVIRAAAPALVLLATTACAANAPSGAGAPDDPAHSTVTVSSTDAACDLSTTTVPSGTVVFRITNDGDQVTEFYLYDESGKSIVSEAKNIGPGLSRDLVVRATAGSYVTACKPGMKGDGIRGTLTVTGSS